LPRAANRPELVERVQIKPPEGNVLDFFLLMMELLVNSTIFT
jgi:hypothetical protein